MLDDEDGSVSFTVTLGASCARALDDWIARSIEPTLSRGEAVRHVVTAALGHNTPSTILPGLVTGRDIV